MRLRTTARSLQQTRRSIFESDADGESQSDAEFQPHPGTMSRPIRMSVFAVGATTLSHGDGLDALLPFAGHSPPP